MKKIHCNECHEFRTLDSLITYNNHLICKDCETKIINEEYEPIDNFVSYPMPKKRLNKLFTWLLGCFLIFAIIPFAHGLNYVNSTYLSTYETYINGIGGNTDGLLFNGINDYIKLNEESSLRFNENDFSVCINLNIKSYNFPTLIAKRDANDDGWRFAISSTGTVWFSINELDAKTSATVPLNVNTWVCGVVDRENNIKIYINDILNATLPIDQPTMSTTINPYIGRETYSSSNYFNGSMNEFLIYSRAISLSDIQSIETGNIISLGLLYYNEMNQLSDFSGNNIQMYTVDNINYSTDGVNNHGNFLIQDNYLKLSNDYHINDSFFSISAWVYNDLLNYDSTPNTIMRSYESSGGLYFDIFNGNVRLYYMNTTGALTGVTSDGTLLENRWYNIIGVVGDGYTKIYVNGILFDESTTTGHIKSETLSPFTIGAYYNSGTPLYYLKGKISDINIFDHDLSDDEVIDLYASEGVNYDTASPIIGNIYAVNSTDTYLLQSSYNYESFDIAVNISDDIMIYSINLTLNGENINYTSGNLGKNIEFNQFIVHDVGSHVIDLRVCDGHTKSEIDDFVISKDKDTLNIDKIVFNSDSVDIIPIKNIDRYEFDIDPKKLKDQKIEMYSPLKINIISNSQYIAHMVTGNLWVDFVNDKNILPKVTQIDDNNVIVDFSDKIKEITKFNSIGEINCVNKSVSFAFADIPTTTTTSTTTTLPTTTTIVNGTTTTTIATEYKGFDNTTNGFWIIFLFIGWVAFLYMTFSVPGVNGKSIGFFNIMQMLFGLVFSLNVLSYNIIIGMGSGLIAVGVFLGLNLYGKI